MIDFVISKLLCMKEPTCIDIPENELGAHVGHLLGKKGADSMSCASDQNELARNVLLGNDEGENGGEEAEGDMPQHARHSLQQLNHHNHG